MAGGNIEKKAKTCTIIIPEISTKGINNWLTMHGIKSGVKIILYKRVSIDLKTQENTKNETLWKIGETLGHKNWSPENNECGEGKFHACPKPYLCDEFRTVPKDRYIAIEINKKDLFTWDDHPQYPHKIAFRKGKVLYECDKFGNKINDKNNI